MSDESTRHCFLPGNGSFQKICSSECMAYVPVGVGKTNCRLLNALDNLIPTPARPTPPSYKASK